MFLYIFVKGWEGLQPTNISTRESIASDLSKEFVFIYGQRTTNTFLRIQIFMQVYTNNSQVILTFKFWQMYMYNFILSYRVSFLSIKLFLFDNKKALLIWWQWEGKYINDMRPEILKTQHYRGGNGKYFGDRKYPVNIAVTAITRYLLNNPAFRESTFRESAAWRTKWDSSSRHNGHLIVIRVLVLKFQ